MLYLLPKEVHLYSGESEGQNEKKQKRGGLLSFIAYPFVWLAGAVWRVHEGFDRLFERLRSAYGRLLGDLLDRPWLSAALMLGFALGSLALIPFLGQDFFPTVDAGQFRLHVRAPAGTRIEETEALFGRVEDAIRKTVPDGERSMILDNMGLTQSFTIMAYVDNGTLSDSDGEILVSLKPDHRPTADYVARLRNELPKRFPDCTFYFMPADITSQILDFGLLKRPFLHRRAGGRRRPPRRPGRGPEAPARDRQTTWILAGTSTSSRSPTGRDLQLPRRGPHRGVGTGPRRRTTWPTAGCWCRFKNSTDPACAQLLGQPAEPRELPRRRADARLQGQLRRRADEHADHRRPDAARPGGDEQHHERRDEHAERTYPDTAAAPEQPDELHAPHHVAGAEYQPLQRPAGLRGLRQRAGPRPGDGVRRRAENHRRRAAEPAARQHHRPPRSGPEHERTRSPGWPAGWCSRFCWCTS